MTGKDRPSTTRVISRAIDDKYLWLVEFAINRAESQTENARDSTSVRSVGDARA